MIILFEVNNSLSALKQEDIVCLFMYCSYTFSPIFHREWQATLMGPTTPHSILGLSTLQTLSTARPSSQPSYPTLPRLTVRLGPTLWLLEWGDSQSATSHILFRKGKRYVIYLSLYLGDKARPS